MKVGDFVVRAATTTYNFISGIIVEKNSTSYLADEILEYFPSGNPECSNQEYHFVVLWSDGTTSKELPYELKYLKNQLEESMQ